MLEEVSGLAASISNPGLMWVHNDSHNSSQIFLIDDKIQIHLTCTLQGVTNRDWEDITVGPGPEPGKTYIYVGEIGDNLAQFEYKIIYRFEEPVLKKEQSEFTITHFDKIIFKLADGKKDTEALLINPLTKDLYIISKREEPVYVYELKYPYAVSDTLVANSITTLPLTQIVAGAFSADGKEILLKNYQAVYYWQVDESKSIVDVFKDKTKVLPYIEEPQGEALTFARDGSGYYTLSEKVKGEKSFLLFYKRK